MEGSLLTSVGCRLVGLGLLYGFLFAVAYPIFTLTQGGHWEGIPAVTRYNLTHFPPDTNCYNQSLAACKRGGLDTPYTPSP